MNILLITVTPKSRQKLIKDLLDEFISRGHFVYIVCPAENEEQTREVTENSEKVQYLYVKGTYSVGKVSLVNKVLGFLTVDHYFKRAIKRTLKNETVDLIVYQTPPITLLNTVKWAKSFFKAKTYLMLKDIFPQNAVDMGMLSTKGLKGLVYRYFRYMEKGFYGVSDHIGCMSKANIEYVIQHNPEIKPESVGLCVNSYKLTDTNIIDREQRKLILSQYGVPAENTVFLYGGNLGKPQGLDFFVKVLDANINKSDRFFLICGSGNEQAKLSKFIEDKHPNNVRLMNPLPAAEYDRLMSACDVGLVFLDYRFTIPNYPSRMLSIMLNSKPILAATDVNTDVNDLVSEGNLGWWVNSYDVANFCEIVDYICDHQDEIILKGANGRRYYESHFTPQITCDQILRSLK